MTREQFLQKMLAKGKITQVKFDKIIAKINKKAEVKSKSDTDLNKLSKSDLIKVIRELS
jgi:hypothetical protein